MKKVACLMSLLFCFVALPDFKILDNAAEFKAMVQESQVPVIVQFSAYWCNPCQALKATFTKIATDYTDDKVILAYVDAYENTELKTYLLGGYPTTRSFFNGKLLSKKFVGSNSEQYVRDFVDSVIEDPTNANFCPVR